MLDHLDCQVDEILKKEETENIPTLSEITADVVSEFGGSWKFIIIFMCFFGGWIAFNLFVYSFDQYPFILLNLILSCISVFQAPFILMTQNRLTNIDRKRAENDYRIDLKVSLEIVELQKKLDSTLEKLDTYLQK
jgi:uncharacterized membrane protein